MRYTIEQALLVPHLDSVLANVLCMCNGTRKSCFLEVRKTCFEALVFMGCIEACFSMILL